MVSIRIRVARMCVYPGGCVGGMGRLLVMVFIAGILDVQELGWEEGVLRTLDSMIQGTCMLERRVPRTELLVILDIGV